MEVFRRKPPAVIDQEYVNSICELLTEKNQLLTHGRITAIRDNKIDIIQREGDDDFAPSFRFGMPVKLNVFNVKLGLKVLAGIIHGSGNGRVRIAGAEVLQDSERREFVRVPSPQVGMLYSLSEVIEVPDFITNGTNKLNIKSVPSCQKVRIENISLSGLQFSCFEKFRKGERFLVAYTPISEQIHLQCEVVRSFKDELDRYHYGCRLLQMRDDEIDELSKLVMRLQLVQRGKRL
ncbi:PilZ domain-containing protein [Christensenellaceae bacterium OttesenSCG-928-M15]|nr:PilZ domain-containing protein [Christensenellaceae bacterium OttesenSCG-928-M15]